MKMQDAKALDNFDRLRHHVKDGSLDQRTVTYDVAVAAVAELLDLIEAWTAVNATPKP